MEDLIKNYKKLELYDLALQMVGANQISSQVPQRDLIRNLLPINIAFGYYHKDTFKWKDPRNSKVYSESFKIGDEEGRKVAIKKINDRIRKYNNFLEKLKKKVGIEKTFELKYFPEHEFWMWGINFVMSHPTIKQKNWFGRDQEHYGIRNVNNEFCYTRGLQLEKKDFVPRFNKMMYEYINVLCPPNKPVVESHVLHNAIIEYENWFMMNGQIIQETPSLIQEVNGKTKNPVSQSPDPNNELETAHKLLIKQREMIKQLRNPSELKVKEGIVFIFSCFRIFIISFNIAASPSLELFKILVM